MTNNKNEITTIYVVRHGESQSNVYAQQNPDKPASHFGEFGSSLTQLGRQQVHNLLERLKHIHFSAFFSSHLNRAKETAEILAAPYHLSIIHDKNVRELFFGEPMSHTKKQEVEKVLIKLNEQEKFSFKYFSNGESMKEAATRFKKFLEEIVPNYRGKTILIVSHGYIMRSFLIQEAFAKFDELRGGSIKNAGYFVIKTDSKSFKITDRHGITCNRGVDNEE